MGNITEWEDFFRKHKKSRDEMSEEEEREYVNDCFACYEKEGFAKKFWSPFGDYPDRFGQSFDVVKRCEEGDADLTVLPMWNIKFADGKIVGAYPEEIIPREMMDNGCSPDFFK